jgi:hypothetical protein
MQKKVQQSQAQVVKMTPIFLLSAPSTHTRPVEQNARTEQDVSVLTSGKNKSMDTPSKNPTAHSDAFP